MFVDIVLCSDRDVLPGLAVTVRSALEHATRPLRLNLITHGLTETDKAKLSKSWEHPRCAGVRFADIPWSRLQKFRSTGYLKSKLAYARYFMAEIFPDIERCVYLDTDLLVLRDICEANDLELGSNLAAAVRDVSVRTSGPTPDLTARLGLRRPENYFNSGFLVVDLASWRREEIEQKLIDLSITRYDDLHAQDQDALNVVLEDRVLLIDPDWNTSQYEKPLPLEGKIIHLIGTVKPWHARYKAKFRESYYEDEIYGTFIDVLDRTAFKGWRPLDLHGLGGLIEAARHAVPTSDMALGKIRRMLNKLNA